MLSQLQTCEKFGVEYDPVLPGTKIGISSSAMMGVLPINGLRCYPEKGESGWYIWGGEDFSQDPDFFKPLHVEHINSYCSSVMKFLGLPPGWRFLISDDYEDVWFDSSVVK